MAGNRKIIKIKSDGNGALKKLLDDLNIAETINNEKQVVEKNEKWTSERWYQELKNRWYFHLTSWYMLQERANTQDIPVGAGCNPRGCVEQCQFYQEEGKIEDSDIQQMIEVLSHFPAVREAQKELEEELKMPLSALQKQIQQETELLKQLRNQPFWIWYRHLHLLQYLRTQGKCCFNHLVGEPEKWGRPQPLF